MEEAAKWMLKSAEQGSFRESQLLKRRGYRELLDGGELGSLAGGAQFAMGRFYQEGSGVEKNLAEAVKWYERSAKRGSKEAKFYLAMCYMKGEGVQLDTVRAEKLLEESADAGDTDAKKELDRIRRERDERERKLAQEKAEAERKIAQEKAEKEKKIARLSEIEEEIEERKNRINGILKGTFTGNGDSWQGFDAGKIAMTDASASITEEQPMKRTSEELSDADSMEKINNFLAMAQTETDRLEERLKDIARVKNAYDAKELESRKEKCAPCNGTGSIICARCKGQGEILATERVACPACNGEKRIIGQVTCRICNGNGAIIKGCESCGGKGRFAVASFKLSAPERCSVCNGRGKVREACYRCSGSGKIDGMLQCQTCRGQGELSRGNRVTCPVCDGKGNLKCERCDGRGFTYRPKDGEGTQVTNGGEGTANVTNEQNSNLGSGRRRRR